MASAKGGYFTPEQGEIQCHLSRKKGALHRDRCEDRTGKMAGLLRLWKEHRFVSADEIKMVLSSPTLRTKMLAFDDIQHILLTRAPALTGRYEFLSFRSPAGGRAWLAAILDKVHSAQAMRASIDLDKRWVTVAFTWNGLRALGVPEQSLATFPEEFQQ